jgi:hypothetical protein
MSALILEMHDVIANTAKQQMRAVVDASTGIHAAEALQNAMRGSGIDATARAEINSDGCTVVIFARAVYAQIEAIFTRLQVRRLLILADVDNAGLQVRSYSVDYLGSTIAVVATQRQAPEVLQ